MNIDVKLLKVGLYPYTNEQLTNYFDDEANLLVVNIHHDFVTQREFKLETLHTLQGKVDAISAAESVIRLTDTGQDDIDISYHRSAGSVAIIKIDPEKVPSNIAHEGQLAHRIMSQYNELHGKIGNAVISVENLNEKFPRWLNYYNDGTVQFSPLHRSGNHHAFSIRFSNKFGLTTTEFQELWAYLKYKVMYQPVLDMFFIHDTEKEWLTLEFVIADNLTLNQCANLQLLILEATDRALDNRDYNLKNILEEVRTAREAYRGQLSVERQEGYIFNPVDFVECLNIR